MVTNVLVYLGVVLVPTAAFYLARRGVERLARWSGPRRRRTEAAGPDLAQLRYHLQRLDAEYARLEASSVPAKASRLRTVSLAYDDTLRECCAVLGLPEPGRPPLLAASRLQAEAALAQRGVTW